MRDANSTRNSTSGEGSRSARIDDIIIEVLQRRLNGEDLPDEKIVAQHPQLMPELADELELAAELRASHRTIGPQEDTSPPSSENVTVRCPHCRQTLQLSVRPSLRGIRCSTCGSRFSIAPDATEDDNHTRHLGNFQLVERLGAGSFGTVWKAYDSELDRTVAVKVPHRRAVTSDEISNFLREARAAAQLNHPHIVTVHEIGRVEDMVIIVSDLIVGRSLSEWAAQERPNFGSVALMCAKLADALQHAHSNGVIHRDLKPENVMIDGECEPNLMDFGLARRETGEATVTLDGHILGTPAYMSPEQARGDAHQADQRCDIYSLGVILFELLTDELPFRGNSRMLIHQLLHDEVSSPRILNRNIPKDLETICLKCLEKEPAKRYRTARDVFDELHRFLRGEPIQAQPISIVGRGWRWCRRNPAWAALSSLLLLAAIAGPLTAMQQSRLRRIAIRQTVEANVGRAESLAGSGKPGQRVEGLKAIADSVSLAKQLGLGEDAEMRMRNAAIACMTRPDIVVVSEWKVDTAAVFYAAFDAALNHYAVQSHIDQPIRVYRLKDHQEVGAFEVEGLIEDLWLNHDGRFLAVFTNSNSLSIWEVSSGKVLKTERIAEPIMGSRAAFAFGKATDRIAIASVDGPVRILALPNLQVQNELPVGELVSCVCFDPDDQSIAICQHTSDSTKDFRSAVTVFRLPDLEVTLDLPLKTPPVSVAMGKSDLLAIGDLQDYCIFDIRLQRKMVTLKNGYTGAVVEFDPTGNYLAIGDRYNEFSTIWDARADCKVLHMDAHFLRFADGRLAYKKPGALGIARLVHDSSHQALANTHAPFLCTIHANNRTLVSPGHDLRIWDLDERRLLAVVEKFHTSALFAPGGDYLYAAASDVVNGPTRLYRWPFRQVDTQSNEWKLGPPERVTLPDNLQPHKLAMDKSGMILATDDHQHGKVIVLYQDHDRPPLVLDAPGSMFVDVSPDGRWLATGTWFNKHVNLYDLQKGRLVKQYSVGLSRVAFTPDGRHLLCGTGVLIDLRTLNQSSLDQQNELDLDVPRFAGGGRIGVFPKRTFDASVLLLDTLTWRAMGRLTGSVRGEKLALRAVSPDGAKAVVQAINVPSVLGFRLDIWNMRAIRNQLLELDLDWDLPRLPDIRDAKLPFRLIVDTDGLHGA